MDENYYEEIVIEVDGWRLNLADDEPDTPKYYLAQRLLDRWERDEKTRSRYSSAR
jgi:hypothetical protein